VIYVTKTFKSKMLDMDMQFADSIESTIRIVIASNAAREFAKVAAVAVIAVLANSLGDLKLKDFLLHFPSSYSKE